MSSAVHQFGRVEFQISNICIDFLTTPALREKLQIFKIGHTQINELPRTKV